MKIKITIIACVLIAAFLLGLTGFTLTEEAENGRAGDDRLIGVFVTTKTLDLFDFESYYNDNALKIINGGDDGDTSDYQGRLYAQLVTRTLTDEVTGEASSIQEYEFTDLEGIPFFSPTMPMENGDSYVSNVSSGVSDSHLYYSYTDEEDSMKLEGTIYTCAEGSMGIYYPNPVYQSADGRVYLVSGSGYSMSGAEGEGMAFSSVIRDSATVTENGETTTQSTEVSIELSIMYRPVSVSIIELDGDSELINRETFEPGVLPEKYNVQPQTEYIIIETQKLDKTGQLHFNREVFSPTTKQSAPFMPVRTAFASSRPV